MLRYTVSSRWHSESCVSIHRESMRTKTELDIDATIDETCRQCGHDCKLVYDKTEKKHRKGAAAYRLRRIDASVQQTVQQAVPGSKKGKSFQGS